jgi:DNA gyrase/topoisomerase IV subunit B
MTLSNTGLLESQDDDASWPESGGVPDRAEIERRLCRLYGGGPPIPRGVGLAVPNLLSAWFEITIGMSHIGIAIQFADGEVREIREIEHPLRGTRVRLLPAPQLMKLEEVQLRAVADQAARILESAGVGGVEIEINERALVLCKA